MQGPSGLRRVSTEKLREVFSRYATKDIKGEKFMTSGDFVRGFLGLFPDENFNEVKKNCSFDLVNVNESAREPKNHVNAE